MANIILRDRAGETKSYSNVQKIFVPKVGGGSEVFYSTSDSTATADKILSGYTAYINNGKISGNIVTKTSSDMTVNANTVTATAGYYADDSSKSIDTTVLVKNQGSVSGTTYVQGTVSIDTAGYIDTGTKVSGATFANTASDTVAYKDISNTTAAPVLISGDYLYINKGYTDDCKISLAKLAPDEGSAELASNHILNGYSAYNNDGVLIAGNIPTKTASDLTASDATVTVPSGYYATNATKSVNSGALGTVSASKSISGNTATITPSINGGVAGYISETSKSGDFVTVTASEIVSGSETKTANGTYDVTNLATVVVAIPTYLGEVEVTT